MLLRSRPPRDPRAGGGPEHAWLQGSLFRPWSSMTSHRPFQQLRQQLQWRPSQLRDQFCGPRTGGPHPKRRSVLPLIATSESLRTAASGALSKSREPLTRGGVDTTRHLRPTADDSGALICRPRDRSDSSPAGLAPFSCSRQRWRGTTNKVQINQAVASAEAKAC